VWLGFDRPKTIAKGAVGGLLAAPIWGQMIGQYLRGPHVRRLGCARRMVSCYAELDRDTACRRRRVRCPTVATPSSFYPVTEPVELRNDPWKVPRWGPLFTPIRASGAPR
jgi:membrane carboxypeptidase/penicillin-binding protein